jgi:RHS repeat-associated protein
MSVTVTPDGASATWGLNTGGHTITFTVRNTGTCTDTYTFSKTMTGPIASVTLNPTIGSAAPGDSTTVVATYSVGSAPGTGLLTVKAQGATLGSDGLKASDNGTLNVTAKQVMVTPDGATTLSRLPGNVGYSDTFRVQNFAATQVTYTLACSSSTNITCGTVTPPSVTLAASASQVVTVGYSTTPAGGNGTLNLTATSGTNTDLGSYTVPIISTPFLLVDVTPDYESAEVEKSQTYTQTFMVRNQGNRQEVINLTRTCTGSAIASGCTPASESITLGPGQSANPTIQVTASATTGTTGQLRLLAALNSTPALTDSGIIDLLITPQAAGGTVVSTVNPGVTVERNLCLSVSMGAAAAYECADLRLVHALPPVKTMGRAHVPTLLYNSNQAHPFVRLAAQVTLPNDGQIPDSVTARLLFGGVEQARGKWVGSNWLAGSTRRIVLSFDASSKATGLYAYDLEVTRWYGASPQNQTVPGELVIINRQSSPFGAGWWLAGLEQLVSISNARKLWIGGDGSVRVFDSVAANLWKSSNVDRLEQLEFDGTNYCRRLLHRGCVLFNANGFHFQTKNRLADVHPWAHRTWFDYDASNRLSAIRLPITNGFLTYTFVYDGAGKLDSVIAPPVGAIPRSEQITITNGQLVSLRDPNGTSVSFGYDAGVSNRVISRTDRRGSVVNYAYGNANALTQATTNLDGGVTIVTNLVPQETKGLAGTPGVAPIDAFTKLDGPRTDIGDTTLFWLDRFGAPSKIRDAIGNETVITRADTNFPSLVTEVRSPNGRDMRAAYSPRGNVDSTTEVNVYGDGHNAVTRYTWDSTWDFVTSIKSPTGEMTQMGYNAGTGNREWQRPGTDPVRNATFFYNDLFLLRATALPGTPAPRDSIQYDSLGNVRFVRSPLGFTNYSYKDNVGRDTLIVWPVDTNGVTWAYQRSRYDLTDQDTLNITWSDNNSDSIVVRKHYDPEGNTDSVQTQSRPDRNNIGWMKRAFTFDRANRQTQELLVGFNTIPFRYDLAGNLTNGGRQGGDGVSVVYDAVNRPIRRSTFEDVATFTYDAVGNLVTANNRYARISRTYNNNGAIRTDTLRLSNVTLSDSTFSTHVYGQRFGYDSSGRRIWAKHPSQLAPAANNDSVAYTYEPIFGQLGSIRDPFGNIYAYTYDALGRPSRITSLAQRADSVYELLTFDLDSRLKTRNVFTGGNSVRWDALTYDARGKLIAANSYEMPGSWSYAPLGPVTGANELNIETFQVDALGNRSFYQGGGQQEYSQYQPGSGRLIKSWRVVTQGGDTTFYQYQGAGMTGRVEHVVYKAPTDTGPNNHQWTLNDYDSQNRLIRSTFERDSVYIAGFPPTRIDYFSEETYRYDALGRRVYTREIRGAHCHEADSISGCRSPLTRTIWDGDQILYEIRIPGDSNLGAALENDTPSPQTHYGRVGYLHAGGIDQPLGLWKGTQLVLPHANYRAVFVMGTCPSATCTGVYFPGRVVTTFIQPPRYPNGPPSWHGSLLESGQDGSGYQYKRNRYYDPGTGRFTQEDPTGLAGGLNVYGFSDGDPVNLSDPFGLRALTPREKLALADLCRDINCNEVNVLDGKGSAAENAQRAVMTAFGRSMTWGHDIALTDEDVAELESGSVKGMARLAHEMTHVVEFEKYGVSEYARRGINDRAAEKTMGMYWTYYNNTDREQFRFDGHAFWGYNPNGLEHQATIVEECFKGRRAACWVSPYKPH